MMLDVPASSRINSFLQGDGIGQLSALIFVFLRQLNHSIHQLVDPGRCFAD